MSTAAEKAAIQEVLRHYTALRQAAADAEFWHERYQQEIQANFEQEVARINAESEQSASQTKAAFDQVTGEAQATVEEVRQSLGILAADWRSDLWRTFDPALRRGVPQAPDPLTGLEALIGGYGSASAVPGGVRLGIVQQPGLERPLQNVPALARLSGQGHILIISRGGAKTKALRLLQSIATRVVLTFPVLSARFVFIDPLGLGDNFPFKRLPESIRGDAVYSEQDEIRNQMRELTEHLRRVTQKYLAREYENIEDYNRDAEEVVEPYRFLCVADFPSNFDTDAATRLLSVAEKGVRTGVYVLMHINADSGMPRDFDLEALKRTATVILAESDGFKLPIGGDQYAFIPDDVPESSLFNDLMDKISLQAEHGEFQGIPFEKIIADQDSWWQGDSRSLIQVPIGRTGARDLLYFWLGKQKDGRISTHALVGGKTGSGKSTLFHVLINSLALTYSPDELELYLVDFKEGVEFKPYADFSLPHARVIAIESEREFGLSVFRKLQAELEQRGTLFKQANAQDLNMYRERTGNKLPRIVLIVDEFQKMFEEQDSLAYKAAQILEDLARRGRAFGIHAILGSQSIKVANLSNAVYGQFAIRIALQSPEDDLAALLGPDNVAAGEILERPGEVIYNDDGGRRDRNQPGQVALLREAAIPRILSRISELAQKHDFQRAEPQIIFRGDRGSSLSDNSQLEQLYMLADWPAPRDVKEMFGLREWVAAEKPALAWLGEAIEIKPHTSAAFRRRSRSNLLIVGENEEIVFGMLGGVFISLGAFYRPGEVEFRIIDLSLKEEEWEDTCEHFQQHFSFHDITVKERRGATDPIDEVSALLKQRQEHETAGEDEAGPSVFLVLAGMHRLSALRSVPSRFGRDEPSEYANKLLEIIQRGPELGIHTVAWCDSAKNFDTMLGRQTLAWFDRRVALPMSKDNSQFLLGEPIAGTLQHYRAILADEEQATPLEKFKPYALPAAKTEREQFIRAYGDRLRTRLDK